MTKSLLYCASNLRLHLNLFVKYMTHGEGSVTLKGFVSVETRELAKVPEDLEVEPEFTLSTMAGAPVHMFKVKSVAHSYW